MRFNPSPNWPTPQAGWTPPRVWRPDPAWGPPPAGQQLVDEPPKGGMPSRLKITRAVVGVLVALGVIGALTGCGDDPSTTPAASQASAAEKAAEAPAATAAPKAGPPPDAAGIGDKVRVGEFEYTVVKVVPGGKALGKPGFQIKALGRYVLVTLKVANVGDEPLTFSESAVQGFDQEGRVGILTGAAEEFIEPDNMMALFTIDPGKTKEGQIVFDLPEGSELAALKLDAGVVEQLYGDRSDGVWVALK